MYSLKTVLFGLVKSHIQTRSGMVVLYVKADSVQHVTSINECMVMDARMYVYMQYVYQLTSGSCIVVGSLN